MYSQKGLENVSVIVDSNHCNSGKQYIEQIRICNEVLHSMRHNDDIKRFVKGFMIESYIEDGISELDSGDLDDFGSSFDDDDYVHDSYTGDVDEDDLFE